MATNEVFEPVGTLNVPVPSGTVSGDAFLLFDAVPCVAQTDRDADGEATVALNPAWVFDIPVVGEKGAGNAAIAVGDPIAVDTDDEINGDITNGTLLGYALEAVSSGATTTIRVLLASA
jgi:hypothetical protein